MKKLLLLLIAIGLFAETPTQDLPDFTPKFSIRSLFSGDVLRTKNSSLPTSNWVIRDIYLEDLRKSDSFELTYKLGYVQFVHPNDPNRCLGIDEGGFFDDRSCKQDIDAKHYETVFSIMPTATGAVQIRSLVLNKDECIVTFEYPGGVDFGINPCDLDRLFFIDLKNLLIIAPALEDSTLNQ